MSAGPPGRAWGSEGRDAEGGGVEEGRGIGGRVGGEEEDEGDCGEGGERGAERPDGPEADGVFAALGGPAGDGAGGEAGRERFVEGEGGSGVGAAANASRIRWTLFSGTMREIASA